MCIENLNYPYLLAVHILCIDGQLHQNELRFLQSLTQHVDVDTATEVAAELILSQADNHLSVELVLQQITPDQYHLALSLALLAAHFDGTLDRNEQKLLERLKHQWHITDDLYEKMQTVARQEAQGLIAEIKATAFSEISTGAKMLSGLEAVLGRGVVDRVIDVLGTASMKARIQDYRIEALLSGPKYEKAIAGCRSVGLSDIEVVDNCLLATADALRTINEELDNKIAEIIAHIGERPAQAAREALRSMKDDRAEIERVINHELHELQELQIKKRRAMNFYTIAFMGRSKAGKSTLHAVVTGGGWDQIGVGRQNTTRLNRVYEWNNIRIIDTPGIATPGGEDLEEVAKSVIDEADLICFVVTNNNQQASEFEFLKLLRSKGKPLLVLLNVKEDLSNPVRLKRFLEKPDQAFSEEKQRLGGHIDRIRRDAAEYYGTSNFPIIPLQLLAAQIAQQQPDHEYAETLMKASRVQNFMDSIRLSLLDEGLLRRSQNLLGSTVADIERSYMGLKNRSNFYLNFSKQISDRAEEATLRLRTAKEDHANQLKQGLLCVFADLQQEVPDFAEDHWADSESQLNKAWLDKLRCFGMEKKINLAQEKALEAFSSDITDLLEEIERELTLNHRLSISASKLKGQESSAWAQQSSKWGGGILGTIGSVLLALPAPEPFHKVAGAILVGIGLILGVLSSLLESKSTKRRKAVARISSEIESQIEEQQKQVVEKALKHFYDQCAVCAAAVQDYFHISADGLSFAGQTLKNGIEILQRQSDILNTHFAARILDFADRSPSESSAELLRAQIREVRRKVGESIYIEVSSKLLVPKDLNLIESVIQEKITLQQAGV